VAAVSPRAQRLAEKHGANIAHAVPSGPNGRIIERDIEDVIKQSKYATSAAKTDYTAGNETSYGTGIGGRVSTSDLAQPANSNIAQSATGDLSLLATGDLAQPAAASASAAPTNAVSGAQPATSDLSQHVVGALSQLATGNLSEQEICDLSQPAAAAAAPASLAHSGSVSGDAIESVPLSNMRKVIAKAMHTSLKNTAQLTLNSSFDASDILAFRTKLKDLDKIDKPANIGMTDIIVYAVSRVIIRHKSINAHLEGDVLKKFSNAHIGVAVDTPRGLMVPTIFNASSLSLAETAVISKELYEMCRQGSINPDLLCGATFTISNLGAFGVESFTPVLNPPQVGLLGVCSITERTKKGGIAYPAMGLSLTFDHRALDGADAARFLKELVEYLERFSLYAALG
jgi:pyruvate/2-oxoglutarate dehydrogenase complex dihydrolipoamide acyltransferase (E2) component